MTEDGAWLNAVPDRFRTILRRRADGDLPAPVAAMQLLLEATAPQEAQDAVSQVVGSLQATGQTVAAQRLATTLGLLRAHVQAYGLVKAVMSGVEHQAPARSPAETVAHWADVFDRAARVSPEGSVALYSLGEPALLRAATDEIVERMHAWGLLGADRTLLDLGCGIGRFEEALAPKVAHIIGLDISREMIALARQRCAGLGNVRLEQSNGCDLSALADASIDLIFSVDAFPYLVHAGMSIVQQHVCDAARVLRPGGTLLILNFSYRGDPEADRADVARMAARFGFSVVRDGTREFSQWDGCTFLLSRAS